MAFGRRFLSILGGVCLVFTGCHMFSSQTRHEQDLRDRAVTITEARVLRAHTADVWAVQFSRDGKVIVSGGGDRKVRLWDAASGAALESFDAGHEVYALAFSTDGKLLAAGAGDRIAIWDFAARRKTRELVGRGGAVNALAFSDGGLLAAGSNSGVVQLWDVAEGRNGGVLDAGSNAVLTVAFSPDGRTVAAGGRDNRIRVWKVATRESVASFRATWGNNVRSVVFSADGKNASVGHRGQRGEGVGRGDPAEARHIGGAPAGSAGPGGF